MIKWFKKQMTNYENKNTNKVITAIEKYKEIPADKKLKRTNKLIDIFVAVKIAKEYEIFEANYIGGYYLMEKPKKNLKSTIVNDTFILDYEDGILIDIDKIKDITLNTEEQIRHRVTVTRLVTAGILALAIPKREAEIMQYLVINFEENGLEQELVLAGKNLGRLHAELYKRVNKIQ